MIEDPYENLANTIIVQAAMDYRANGKRRPRMISKTEKAERNLEAATLTNDEKIISRAKARLGRAKEQLLMLDAEQNGIERFFQSEWFQLLTKADGDMILRKLQAEVRK